MAIPHRRDDGLSYTDYAEQLTILRFLKMANGQRRSPDLGEEKRRDAAATLGRRHIKESMRLRSFT